MNLFYRRIISFSMCFISYIGSTQVGIGTTSPNSELEIATMNAGIPALELNPQSAPVGTRTGQLAVIGDELYMYDATRVKWLSVGATAIQFGNSGNVNTDTLNFGGTMDNENVGCSMPANGTIIAITAGVYANATKSFELRVKDYNPITNVISTTQSYTFGLTDYAYISMSLNLDFDATDFITVRGAAGGNASDPSVIIWVKWRQ